MRIAFLSATAQPGGAERVLLDLLASLRAAEPGWSLNLVCGADGWLPDRAAALGVSVSIVPLPPSLAALGDAGLSGAARRRLSFLAQLAAAAPGALVWLARLRSTLRRIAPDVVHTNGFKMHVLGARALPRGARLVWHLHDYVSPRRMMAGLMRRSAGRCAAALAVSDSVGRDARAACGAGLRVETVRNAVELARFAPEGARLDLARAAGMPAKAPGTVSVGLVATMGLWKGHAVFLDAVSRLPAHLPVRAYVVGGGIYRTAGSEVSVDALRARAAALGIGGRVGFTGFVDDPAAAMRALDVVVHASTQPEPFGLVIAEAMACGRAVVVSAAGGAAEIVRDGRDALTVSPGDAEALASAVARLAGDAELRAELGRAGRETAERGFDRARLAAEAAAVYRSLAGGR